MLGLTGGCSNKSLEMLWSCDISVSKDNKTKMIWGILYKSAHAVYQEKKKKKIHPEKRFPKSSVSVQAHQVKIRALCTCKVDL